jgi:hypothetical protein
MSTHPKRPPARKKPTRPRAKTKIPALPPLELDQIATARLNGDKRASLLLQNAVTGLKRTLTMENQSTLEMSVHDPDYELLRSDLLGEPLTLTLPGGGGTWLYRRGRDVGGLDVRGASATIRLWDITAGTLRAQSGPLARSSGSLDLGGWTRLLARERPVLDAIPGLRVLVFDAGARPHPETTRETASTGGSSRSSGTFKRQITVKRVPATGTQRRVIDEALAEASGLGASRRLQIAVVMALTQESRAGEETQTTGNDDASYLQQGRNWITLANSRDVGKAVRAFLLGPDADVGGNDRTVKGWKQTHGSLRNAAGNLDAMITAVQRPASGGGYAPWEAEATRTVDAWTGTPTNTRFTRAYTGQTADTATSDTTRPGAWRRGTRDQPESSWTSLGRHAGQLGYRRFVALPMSRAPRLVVARDQTLLLAEPHQVLDGLDDPTIISEPSVQFEGIRRAQTIEFDVRLDEWETPPGGVVRLREAGGIDGPWLCQTIQQTAGDPIAKVTLQQATTRAEPIPPASTAGTTTTSSSSASPGGTSTASGLRQLIVAEASRTLTSKTGFRRYSMTGATTSDPTPPAPARTDCSQWVRAIYLRAGAPDPGTWSGEQARRGQRTTTPRPGDLVLDAPSGLRHVELYVGDGRTIGHGTAPIDYWTVEGMRQHFGGVFFVTFPSLDRRS